MQPEHQRDLPPHEPQEASLPLTLGFVVVYGAAIFVGWFLLYFLLRARI